MDEKPFVRIIPARKIGALYVLAPIFFALTTAALVSMSSIFKNGYTPIVGKLVFLLFFLFFLYMACTSLLALFWILFGKEKITVDGETLRVTRILFVIFSDKRYEFGEISGMYVNYNDWMFNKISKGRNDFLTAFRFGTTHFYYRKKLMHIAGGMTELEGRVFLDEILSVKSDDFA